MDPDNQTDTLPPCLDRIGHADLLTLWHYTNSINLTSADDVADVDDVATSVRYDLSFFVIIAVSSVSVIVNGGSLLAIWQVKRVTTYLRLVASLSLSDILVGVRVLFSSLDVRPFTSSNIELCAFVYLRGLRMTSHLISLFNLLGLGLDHYGAIVKPIKYRSRRSATRTNLMIASFWIVSLLCGYSDLFIPAPVYTYCVLSQIQNDEMATCTPDYDFLINTNATKRQNITSLASLIWSSLSKSGLEYLDRDVLAYPDDLTNPDEKRNPGDFVYPNSGTYLNDRADPEGLSYPDTDEYPSELTNFDLIEKEGFCYSVMCSRYDPEYIVFLLAALLMVVMSFIYVRVCIRIYVIRRRLRGTRSRRVFRRNKKGLVTTLCIVGTFMVCWLPFCLFTCITIVRMIVYPESSEDFYRVAFKVDRYLYALLLLNSLCDPAIYAFRMREVQAGYHRLVSRCWIRYKGRHLASGVPSASLQMSSHFWHSRSSRSGASSIQESGDRGQIQTDVRRHETEV